MTRVTRNQQSYRETDEFIFQELERFQKQYQSETQVQTRRLIRDSVDFLLRRYHTYAVIQRHGAHYREQGVERGILEHVVPNRIARDLLLNGELTIPQACNMPICRISRENDQRLRDKGFTSTTPDWQKPWQRYTVCQGTFVTRNGETVTLEETLEDHFRRYPIEE